METKGDKSPKGWDICLSSCMIEGELLFGMLVQEQIQSDSLLLALAKLVISL